MDSGYVPLCSLFTASMWPVRVKDLQTLYPELPSATPFDRALWASILRCVEHDIPADLNDYHSRIVFDMQVSSPTYAGNAAEWLQASRARTDVNEELCMGLLKDHAIRRICLQFPLVEADDVSGLVAQIMGVRAVGVVSAGEPADIFANDGADVLQPMLRVPIPVHPLTVLFHGLPPTGTLTLFVMPTKAGKTLLSLQTSAACVESGISVLYLNFEQTVRGDLSCRVFCLMSGDHIDEFKRVSSLLECPAAVQTRVREAKPAWDAHFKIYGATELYTPGVMAQGVNSLQGLVETQYVRKGLPPPGLIIIDWWQKLWDCCKTDMGSRIQSDSTLLRSLEGQHFHKLKGLAALYDTRVIVFQQMRDALAGQAFNIDNLTAQDAANNKSLPSYTDATVVTTTKTDDQHVTLKLALDRNQTGGNRVCVRVDGGHQMYLPSSPNDEQSPDTEIPVDDDSPISL